MADISKVKQSDSFKTMVSRVNETIDKVNGIGVTLSDMELEVKDSLEDMEDQVNNGTTETTAAEMNAYLTELYGTSAASASEEVTEEATA